MVDIRWWIVLLVFGRYYYTWRYFLGRDFLTTFSVLRVNVKREIVLIAHADSICSGE